MVQLQYVQGDELRERGKRNVKDSIVVPADRGNIYSADGKLMAGSITECDLYMDFGIDTIIIRNEHNKRERTTHKAALHKYIDTISQTMAKVFDDGRTAKDYRSILLRESNKNKKSRYFLLKKNATEVEYNLLKECPLLKANENVSGFMCRNIRPKRIFPYGSLAKRTIGGIQSGVGRYGLEKYYEDKLKGQDGFCKRQRIVGTRERISVNDVEPVEGTDIITTIDTKIQDIAEEIMRNALENTFDADSGCVIIMEVKTGEIKAVVNLIRLDENGKHGEVNDIAFCSGPEPGSTFKIASIIAGLEEGVIDLNDSIDTSSPELIKKYASIGIHDHRKGGFGKITAANSIKHSSNVGTAELINKAFEKEPEKFIERLYAMKLNEKLEMEIPGSANPRIHNTKDKRWNTKTSIPSLSIGYTIQMPPIYTLMFYNAIANNGKMLKPYLVKAFSRNGEEIETFASETVTSSICSQRTLNLIRPMLDSVVEYGTGRGGKSNLFRIAGKTGTVLIDYWKPEQIKREYQVSFCGYFPSDKPIYSGIVVVRRPKKNASGSVVAKVFKDIAEKIYAQKFYSSVDFIKIDTAQTKTPVSGNGHYKELKNTLSYLQIKKVDESNEQNWVKTTATEDAVRIAPLKVNYQYVPNVTGMSAKDAVYLLESCGMSVNVMGTGNVKNQSVPAGDIILKGKKVILTLSL